MEQSRILLIGERQGPFRTCRFGETLNLAEFGAAFWYLEAIHVEWQHHGVRSTVARLPELIEWIRKGNTLVIVGDPGNPTTTYSDGPKQVRFDILKCEIFRDVRFKTTSGSLVEFSGPESLTELATLAGWLSYDVILESKEILPLFRVSTVIRGETQIVGGYKKLGNGIVVFIPPLAHTQPQSPEFFFYHMRTARILEALKQPAIAERPDWFNNFQTSDEHRLGQAIEEARGRISEIEEYILKIENDRRREQSEKILFTATGDALVSAVAEALRELGFRVVEGPKQRADLIIWDGFRLAALEVKGLEGGAREKNIGQVNRWKADVAVALSCISEESSADTEIAAYQAILVELGVSNLQSPEMPDCKGIVILNTHRKLPLDARPESFGQPVTKVATRSDVCALTGLQLFSILREVREDASRTKEISDKLFSTNGLLAEGTAWQKHLLQHGERISK